MYNLGSAYFLWFVGGFGWLGLHRFYLGMPRTGRLWLFTLGLLFVGSVTDFVRMPTLVREANLRLKYKEALLADRTGGRSHLAGPGAGRADDESLELTILRTAKNNAGIATPGEVALESHFRLEEAQTALDKLAKGGFCEMRIRDSGVIVYYFAEFAEPNSSDPGGIS